MTKYVAFNTSLHFTVLFPRHQTVNGGEVEAGIESIGERGGGGIGLCFLAKEFIPSMFLLLPPCVNLSSALDDCLTAFMVYNSPRKSNALLPSKLGSPEEALKINFDGIAEQGRELCRIRCQCRLTWVCHPTLILTRMGRVAVDSDFWKKNRQIHSEENYYLEVICVF